MALSLSPTVFKVGRVNKVHAFEDSGTANLVPVRIRILQSLDSNKLFAPGNIVRRITPNGAAATPVFPYSPYWHADGMLR
jgi:hypothetical protein